MRHPVPLAIGVFCILSCGGGGSGLGGSTVLNGVINAESFVIAAGETKTAGSSLRVNATKSLKIDGKLLVPKGATVMLFSDDELAITGEIAAAPAPASRQDNSGKILMDGKNVTVSGSVRAAEGSPIELNASGPNGILTIEGGAYIVGGEGIPSKAAGQPGGDGGNVEIGTASSIQKGKDAGRTEEAAFEKVTIKALAVVWGGRGGAGFNDPGVDGGATLTATGTRGGKGGDALIVATGELANAGTAYGGDGGPGGSCQEGMKAKDSTADLGKGQSVVINGGDGGDGGKASLIGAPKTGTGKEEGGHGAYTGYTKALAGNGGPGGPGGDATVTVGKKGADGPNVAPNPLTKTGIALTGGRGGDAYTKGTAGGNGGLVTIQQAGGGVPLVNFVSVIHRGGTGATGCYPPTVKGGDGGKAFPVVLNGAPANVADYTFCKGGDSGSGDEPGEPGTGPGGNGTKGTKCSENELVVVLDQDAGYPKGTTVLVSLFTNVKVGGPEGGCKYYHLHATGAGKIVKVTKDGQQVGPFEDLSPNGCGFGRVFLRKKSNHPISIDPVAANASCCSL